MGANMEAGPFGFSLNDFGSVVLEARQRFIAVATSEAEAERKIEALKADLDALKLAIMAVIRDRGPPPAFEAPPVIIRPEKRPDPRRRRLRR
jgi:hypothetical protein